MTFGKPAAGEWQRLLSHVMQVGMQVKVRYHGTVEDIAVRSCISMILPVVNVSERNTAGFAKFLPAEAYWILSGDSRVSEISGAAPSMSQFSDNGYSLQGAYGPRVVDQLSYVLDCFRKDINTRQAVIEIWRPNPRESKDIPCTLSLQFLVRDNQMHCIATMRSSDLWLGWPFDVFTFSMITAWIILHLRIKEIKLGTLFLTAGSQHVYERNLAKASAAVNSTSYWGYKSMSLYEFNHPDDLLTHLGHLRDAKWDRVKSNFLLELKDVRKQEHATS